MYHIMTAERTDSGLSSIAAIVNTYGRRLSRFIRERVRNDADAEDILQEVWYQLTRAASAAPIEQVNAWLYRVARNRLTDFYRRKTPEALEDFAYETEEGERIFQDLLLFEANTPETELLKQTLWEAFFAALEELPTAQREVFVWNEMEGETFQSIADRTGQNIKTLISRKRYATLHLRDRLSAFYQDLLLTT